MLNMNLSKCCYLLRPYCGVHAAHSQLRTREEEGNSQAGQSMRAPSAMQNKMDTKVVEHKRPPAEEMLITITVISN